MEMFRDITWLGYAAFIIPVCVLMGAGIDWWMGVLFALGCALLPALAWVTQNTSD
jgi:hypothetical protein